MMTKAQQLEITLYGYLQKHGTMSASSAYLITEERVITYGEALTVVENLGAKFLSLGMKKGDLVAIRATRSPDMALLVIALSSIGAVVVAVKNEKFGEIVGAMIMLEKGVNMTAEDTRCALKDKLSKHEIPEVIEFVTEFPKTSSGKIDKIKVKELMDKKYGR